jgi:hypothetical protein
MTASGGSDSTGYIIEHGARSVVLRSHERTSKDCETWAKLRQW